MYLKVMLNHTAVDVLDRVCYVKWQKKHDILELCPISEAQAVLSSDGKYAWHLEGLLRYEPDPNVYSVEEISRYEYDRLKELNLQTREEIIDSLTMELIEKGIL